jgi:hypothetical protein
MQILLSLSFDMYSNVQLKERTVNVPVPDIQRTQGARASGVTQQSQSSLEDTDVKIVVKATKLNADKGSGFKDHVKVTVKATALLPMDRISAPGASEQEVVDSVEAKVRHLLDAVKSDTFGQEEQESKSERYRVKVNVTPVEGGQGQQYQREFETDKPPSGLESQTQQESQGKEEMSEDMSEKMRGMKLGAGSSETSTKQEEMKDKAQRIASSDLPMKEKIKQAEQQTGVDKEKLKTESERIVQKSKSAIGAAHAAFESDTPSAARRIATETPEDMRSDVPITPVTHKTTEDAPGNIPERVKAAVSAAVHAIKGDT